MGASFKMTKQDAKKIFKKLFVKESRTKEQWFDFLDSLYNEEEITYRQNRKWKYFGTNPINNEKE